VKQIHLNNFRLITPFKKNLFIINIMSQSTNINQLPNINQTNHDDEDNAIHEVLAEIQNENNAHQNGNPQVPIETMQQHPPQPNLPAQPSQINNNHLNSMLDENIQQQLLQRLDNNSNLDDEPSKFNKILSVLKNNLIEIVLIIISFIVLHNPTIQNLLSNKLINVRIPYINLIVLSLIQVVIIMVGKTFI